MKRSDFFKTLGTSALVVGATKTKASIGSNNLKFSYRQNSPSFLLPYMTRKEFEATPNKIQGQIAVCENNKIVIWNGVSIIEVI